MALEVFPSEQNLKLNEKCNIDKCNLKKVHAWKTPLAQEDCKITPYIIIIHIRGVLLHA